MRDASMVWLTLALLSSTLLLAAASNDQRCHGSIYGCCPDGITAALDTNKESCPAVKMCDMLSIPGHCNSSIPSYFYNATTASCDSFIYSGCGGNPNRFSTKFECYKFCQSGSSANGSDVKPGGAGKEQDVMSTKTAKMVDNPVDSTTKAGVEAMKSTDLSVTPAPVKTPTPVKFVSMSDLSVTPAPVTTPTPVKFVTMNGLSKTTPPVTTLHTKNDVKSFTSGMKSAPPGGKDGVSSLPAASSSTPMPATSESNEGVTATPVLADSPPSITDNVTNSALPFTDASIVMDSSPVHTTAESGISTVPTQSANTITIDPTMSHTDLSFSDTDDKVSTHADGVSVTPPVVTSSNTILPALVKTTRNKYSMDSLVEVTGAFVVSTTAPVVGGCAGTRYGCCVDNIRSSRGPNFEGCEEKLTYTLSDYPRNFKATTGAETAHLIDGKKGVELYLRWLPPSDNAVVNIYTVYYTQDIRLPLNKWLQVDTPATTITLTMPKDTPIFFKIRAFNSRQKSPISHTYMLNPIVDKESRQLLGGCYGTRYGCCDDGLTSATGDNRRGCPEQEVVTMLITAPPTAAPRTTKQPTTQLNSKEMKELPPPTNLKVSRYAVAADRVAIDVMWTDPQPDYAASRYILRFTNNAEMPRQYWRKVFQKDKQWKTAMRRSTTHYFTIAAEVKGRETPQSPVYRYDSEDQMGSLYEGKVNCENTIAGCAPTATTSRPERGCRGSRWGCCSDGSAALGPDLIGCRGDRQPCDVSMNGCCPDGVQEARGDNFEGCATTGTTTDKVNPVCLQPKNGARCTNFTVMWYYNSTLHRCDRFWYGGCNTNNKFHSQEKCWSVCRQSGSQTKPVPATGPACSQPPAVVGMCRGKFSRWTFNSKTKRCEKFYYGGCRGNDNRFITREECEMRCTAHLESKALCSLPNNAGPCLASFRRWYYDMAHKTCREFVYGGCLGNNNRFTSLQECQQMCAGAGEVNAAEACTLAIDSGPCRARQPHYAFNHSTGKCERFIYGGCGGNTNRFTDKPTCVRTCAAEPLTGAQKSCDLPKSPGPCNRQSVRWFYNKETGNCEVLLYSGCRGNTNNYKSSAECQKECDQEERTTPSAKGACSLMKASGSCKGYLIKWYFDKERNVCGRFIYTGCEGNVNRFDDRNACMKACKAEDPKPKTTKRPMITTTTRPDKPGKCPPANRQIVVCDKKLSCADDQGCRGAMKCCWSSTCGGLCTPSQTKPVSMVRITNTQDVEYEVKPGDDVTLRCRAVGYPQPIYVWYKNRQPISVSDNDPKYRLNSVNGDLQIRRAVSSDSAGYVCRAYNGIGAADHLRISLLVRSRVTIQDTNNKVESTIGGTAMLLCQVDGTPPPRVRWYFNGFPVSDQTNKNHSLLLYNLRREDAGKYSCVANNGISSDKKLVTLTIIEPLKVTMAEHNQTFTEGDRLFLKCATRGFPPANVRWMRNKQDLSSAANVRMTGHSLMINKLAESDAGQYTCIATNGREMVTASTVIKVTPVVTKPPTPASCGERPDLANCKLIVHYHYCSHPIYRHFCCRSCLKAGRFSKRTKRSLDASFYRRWVR